MYCFCLCLFVFCFSLYSVVLSGNTSYNELSRVDSPFRLALAEFSFRRNTTWNKPVKVLPSDEIDSYWQQ